MVFEKSRVGACPLLDKIAIAGLDKQVVSGSVATSKARERESRRTSYRRRKTRSDKKRRAATKANP
jgi:hypothetical protein